MWESKRAKWFHAVFYCRGTSTILGEAADAQEVFMVDNCESILLSSIVKKVEVCLGAFGQRKKLVIIFL